MISRTTALALDTAGVLWLPAAGDRFALRGPELEDDVFWISELTVEVHHYQQSTVLGFNGTTEWALDSVPLDAALWLPREDQLRNLLGAAFAGLDRDDGGFTVRMRDGSSWNAADVEEAYAAAVLGLSADAA